MSGNSNNLNNNNVGVYVIYCSKMTPNEIKNFLVKFGNKKSVIGPIRVEFNKSKETNRNICILSSDVFFEMKKNGHNTKERKDGISITVYHLNKRNFPPGRWAPMDIYVKLPQGRTAELCRKILNYKLQQIKATGLFKSDFMIDIPFKQRSTGEHLGRGVITFEDEERPKIALVKVMLTNSLWGSEVDKYNSLRVFTNWYRHPKDSDNIKKKMVYQNKPRGFGSGSGSDSDSEKPKGKPVGDSEKPKDKSVGDSKKSEKPMGSSEKLKGKSVGDSKKSEKPMGSSAWAPKKKSEDKPKKSEDKPKKSEDKLKEVKNYQVKKI